MNCAMSRPIDNPRSSGPDDLVIGPLQYPGMTNGHQALVPDPQDGIIFAKTGTELLANATVTVSVTPEARDWAGIATEAGPPAGYFSVTTSGPSSQHADGVWWVGGFTLRNRTSGCLPLNVQVQGEESATHTVISFWDETCT